MIPSDFESRSRMIEYMISGLEIAENLTDWENDFIQSIGEQFEKNKRFSKTLSDKQCEILENIYNKYC